MPDSTSGDAGRSIREVYAAKPPSSTLGILAIGVIVIGALYFARDVFVPLAVAVLLSFALGPIVQLLRRWHLGRVPSALAGVMLAFIIIFSIGTLIGSQLAQLAENLPQYRTNITEKIQSLRSATLGSGIVARTSGMLKDLGNEITKTTEAVPNKPVASTPAPGLQNAQQQEPVSVVIRQPPSTPYGRSLGPRRREAPAQMYQLHPVLTASKNRRRLCRPNVVPRLEIGCSRREDNRCADLAERLQIGAVRDVVAEVVAHGLSKVPDVGSVALVVDAPTALQVQQPGHVCERQLVVGL